jgi:hypothetical protein
MDSHFGRIRQLKRAARNKSAGDNAKYNGVEDSLVLRIERAIDEDTLSTRGRHSCLTVFGHQPNNSSIGRF